MKRWITLLTCVLIASLARGQGGETGGGGGPGSGGGPNLSTLSDDAGCLGNDFVIRNGADTFFDCAALVPLAQITDDNVNTGRCLVSGGSGGVPNFAPCPGGAGGGHTIQEDGTALPARTGLNFTTNITCTDDSANNRTNCAGSGGGGGDAIQAEIGNDGGTYQALTDVDFDDSGDIDFVPNTGTTPDQITAQIRTGTVGTNEIATDGVGTAEIATNAVNSDEIAADAVGASEIAADAVGTSEASGLTTGDVPSGTWDPSRVVHPSANDKCAKFDPTGVLIAAPQDCGAGGGGISTVEDTDGTPSYGSLSTLSFDQADGFAISNPVGTEAEINLSVADGAIAAGAVDGGGGGEIADDTVNHFDIDEADTYSWSGTHTHTANVSISGAETDYASGVGYPRLAQSGTPPTAGCDVPAEAGRLYFDNNADTDGSVFVCRDLDGDGAGTTVGWKDIDDDGGAGGLQTSDIDTSSELVTIVGDETGSATGTPLLVFNQAPAISGKVKRNTVAVNDNACDATDQGSWWYDTTDGRFEFCDASTGTPTLLSASSFSVAGNTGTQTITSADTLTITGGVGITVPVTATDTATVDCDNAAADGSTKGCSTYTSGQFTAASGVISLADDGTTWAKTENMAANTILGRLSTSGDPQELTGTQTTTLLDVFTSSLKGLAPSSGGGTTNYLRADGTWAAPAGSGSVANVGDCNGPDCFTGPEGTKLDSNTDLIFHIDEDQATVPTTASFLFRNGAGTDIFTVTENGVGNFNGSLTTTALISQTTIPQVVFDDTSQAADAAAEAKVVGDSTDDLGTISLQVEAGTDNTYVEAFKVSGAAGGVVSGIQSGKVDRNNISVADNDCTGEQGFTWYDTTDSRFEICNANSGTPIAPGTMLASADAPTNNAFYDNTANVWCVDKDGGGETNCETTTNTVAQGADTVVGPLPEIHVFDANGDGNWCADINAAIDSCGKSFAANNGGCQVIMPRGALNCEQTVTIGAAGGTNESQVAIALLGQGSPDVTVSTGVAAGGTTLVWTGADEGTMINVVGSSQTRLADFSLKMDPTNSDADGNEADIGIRLSGDNTGGNYMSFVRLDGINVWSRTGGTPADSDTVGILITGEFVTSGSVASTGNAGITGGPNCTGASSCTWLNLSGGTCRFAVGDQITVTGTTNHNSTWTVDEISGGCTVRIVDPYPGASETGSYSANLGNDMVELVEGHSVRLVGLATGIRNDNDQALLVNFYNSRINVLDRAVDVRRGQVNFLDGFAACSNINCSVFYLAASLAGSPFDMLISNSDFETGSANGKALVRCPTSYDSTAGIGNTLKVFGNHIRAEINGTDTFKMIDCYIRTNVVYADNELAPGGTNPDPFVVNVYQGLGDYASFQWLRNNLDYSAGIDYFDSVTYSGAGLRVYAPQMTAAGVMWNDKDFDRVIDSGEDLIVSAATKLSSGEAANVNNVNYDTTANVWFTDLDGDQTGIAELGVGNSAGDIIAEPLIGPKDFEIYVRDVAAPTGIDGLDVQAAIDACGIGYGDADEGGGCTVVLPNAVIPVTTPILIGDWDGSTTANIVNGMIIRGQGTASFQRSAQMYPTSGTIFVYTGTTDGVFQPTTGTTTISRSADPDTITASSAGAFTNVTDGDYVMIRGAATSNGCNNGWYKVWSHTSTVLTVTQAGTNVTCTDESSASIQVHINKENSAIFDVQGANFLKMEGFTIALDNMSTSLPGSAEDTDGFEAAAGIRFSPDAGDGGPGTTNVQLVQLDHLNISGNSDLATLPPGQVGVMIGDHRGQLSIQADTIQMNVMNVDYVDIAILNLTLQAVVNTIYGSNIFGIAFGIWVQSGEVSVYDSHIGCRSNNCVVAQLGVDPPDFMGIGNTTVFDNCYFESGGFTGRTIFRIGQGYDAANGTGGNSHVITISNGYYNNQTASPIKFIDASIFSTLVVENNDLMREGGGTWEVKVSNTGSATPHNFLRWLNNNVSSSWNRTTGIVATITSAVNVWAPQTFSDDGLGSGQPSTMSGQLYNDRNLNYMLDAGEGASGTNCMQVANLNSATVTDLVLPVSWFVPTVIKYLGCRHQAADAGTEATLTFTETDADAAIGLDATLTCATRDSNMTWVSATISDADRIIPSGGGIRADATNGYTGTGTICIAY